MSGAHKTRGGVQRPHWKWHDTFPYNLVLCNLSEQYEVNKSVFICDAPAKFLELTTQRDPTKIRL